MQHGMVQTQSKGGDQRNCMAHVVETGRVHRDLRDHMVFMGDTSVSEEQRLHGAAAVYAPTKGQ